MFQTLQVVTVALVSIAMALSLAHAFELPGKLRLDRDAYLAIQSIYYPGFTFGGGSEPLGVLATLVLLMSTPTGTLAFWLTFAALLALAAMHAIFWLITQPVNKFWVAGEKLGDMSARFFSVNAARSGNAAIPDWTVLRDRWEYSHLARAALAAGAFILLVVSLTLCP
ncbi:MAG: DUF1772 domain-containing protein [Pseudolabrys sp.]